MEQNPWPRLAALPTPLTPLERLTADLGGPALWIKRDDLTGLAMGGNKARKLEPLLAEACAQGADVVVTGGAQQSNHCRQTAAAAAKLGLRACLVLGGTEPLQPTGNLLLDKLLGAEIVWAGDDRVGARVDEVAARLEGEGRRPYVIPYGGSNAVGASAYAVAFDEMMRQGRALGVVFDRVVFASSSGGTHAGLLVGAARAASAAVLHGVAIEKSVGPRSLSEIIAALATETAAALGVARRWEAAEVYLDEGFAGPYGVEGPLEREAIALLARSEGILLDPVYTGRAFGGLLQRFFDGSIGRGETVLFWHTGGQPALFA